MKITVFTPVYNRAYIITKLYESLCAQTDKDFEWLVIDDGSTDNIEKLISYFMTVKINSFITIYIINYKKYCFKANIQKK